MALTGKANQLAQRHGPHNKRVKRGPLLRFLQNLPELHPHPLLISAAPWLDADAHRPQLSLLQLSVLLNDSTNTFLLKRRRRGAAQQQLTFYLLGFICKLRMCVLTIAVKDTAWPVEQTFIFTLPAKRSSPCESAPCRCRCSWLQSQAVI